MATGTVALERRRRSAAGARSRWTSPALTGGTPRELRYDFRYFQNFDQELTVPAAFKPEQLAGRGAVEPQATSPPLSQTFLWTRRAPAP